MDATTFWIQTEARKIESQCTSQSARIRTAKTLGDVVRASEISIRGELRAIKNTIPGIRNLEAVAKRAIQVIIDARTSQIAAASSVGEAQELRGKFMLDCEVLRGKFGMEYRIAARESQRALFQLEQRLAPKASNTP